MHKYKIELGLIIFLLFIWEAEFFVLDILPRLQYKAQAQDTAPVIISDTTPLSSDTTPLLIYTLLNEFLPDPEGEDEKGEFIELYNPNQTTIDLANWQLDDIKDGGSKPFIFLSGKKIDPGSYLVLPYSETKIILNNTSDDVRLINPNSEEIEKISYNKVPAGKSYNKFPEGWSWSQKTTPGSGNTPEAEEPPAPPENPENTPNPTTPNVIINELFPNPKGEEKEQEFIEFKNLSDFMAYLIGWQIKDKSGKTCEFILEKIPPQGLLALFYEQSKIQLNNTGGEEVFLYDNYGHLVDSISYQDTIEGYSYNFTDQGWLWSSTPTPEDGNSITQNIEEGNSPQITYPRHLWINEFLPNPEGKDTENEFIEIYNKGPDEIDLENWQVDDCENKGSRPHTFPENFKIAAGEYLAFPYSETKITLNNDEDCVRLLWPNGAAIDEAEYTNPLEGQSYNKLNDRWCWSASLTPGEQNNCSGKNQEEETKEYSRSLWINEFLPNPEGKDTEGEFIELQNRGDKEIDLSAWQIDDCEDQGSAPHTLPENTKIEADSYLVIYYQDTKINLNNDGDCARLITPDGQAIDEITYGKSPEGQSYSRQNVNHWQWTIPSPGQDNNFPQALAASQSPARSAEAPSNNPLALPQTGPNLNFYYVLGLTRIIIFLLIKK